MKINLKITALIIYCLPTLLIGQEYTEQISKTYVVSSNTAEQTLVVENVSGSVTIKAYEGQEVKLTINKTIEGESEKYVVQGSEEVGFGDYQTDSELYLYTKVPNLKFNKETGNFKYISGRDGWRTGPRYDYRMDYEILLPKNMSIDINVINNGNVIVNDLTAETLKVNVINGGIKMKNVAGQTHVNALNDNITISYSTNPTEESWYNSLNGDISITLPRDIDATISHKSLNGDVYTNMETTAIPSSSTRKKLSGKGGVKYKIDSKSKFNIGNGGVKLHFDQLNGDTFIKSR